MSARSARARVHHALQGQAHRERRQAQSPGRVLAPPGGGERQVELAPSLVHRRQLQVDHRRRRQCSERDRLPARLLEPVEVERDEQVDGAELLQRPHAATGPVPPRRRCRAPPGTPPPRPPGPGRVRPDRALRVPRTAPPPGRSRAHRATPPWPEPRRPRRRRVRSRRAPPAHSARARRATSGASAAAASACSSARSQRPAARSADPTSRCTAAWSAGSRRRCKQLRAESTRPFRVPGQHADLQQDVVDLVGERAGGELAGTGGERLRRCQSTLTEHTTRRLQQERSGEVATTGAAGQLGGQQATITIEVLLAERRGRPSARPARSSTSAGIVAASTASRVRPCRNRKLEPSTSRSCTRTPRRNCSAAAWSSRSATRAASLQSNDRPSNAAATSSRRPGRRQTFEPELDRRQHRPRHPVGDRLPSRVDRGEEQLLDEQRDAFAARHQRRRRLRPRACVRRGTIEPCPRRHRRRAAASTTSDATRRLTRKWASSRPSPGLTVAQRDDEQHGLTCHVVGEVLEDGQGLRVGPLQVLDHQRGGARAGERRQEAEHGFPQHQPGPRRGDRRLAPLGHERRQRRHEGRHVSARTDAQPGRAEQRFPDRAQRRSAGGRPDRPAPTPPCPTAQRAELADQPALADAGRPTHDPHGAAVTPRLAQPIDLAVPTHQLTSEQRSGRAHVHHVPTLPHDLDRNARTPPAAWLRRWPVAGTQSRTDL